VFTERVQVVTFALPGVPECASAYFEKPPKISGPPIARITTAAMSVPRLRSMGSN
jgi:hypothetical protein